ncbi:hypothetical protein LOTGIDRAFT_193380 [Lottia gigantea]|uniref:Thioredoxin domain-containing protein 9 n=1 Tax=Lottia gigantea TaxID=225164 RepID=V3ZVV6_LOTGI|nr:hypothetical protein LOTGIDRAFT_193380 [Lottia gigantea]ESO88497.1 hypothetical protein LOTGIDRAFT_193380 [Lottia gigantea]
MEQALEQHLLQATQAMEQQVDAEIEKMSKMDEDDFDALRQKRMDMMKKSAQQKQEWLAQGHGEYTEIANEKEFFDECKKSKKVVCHFFRDSTFRCKIVDKHLYLLAPKHLETRFLKINVEKAPFLVERLRIKVLPTICVAKNGKTTDYIVGFNDLGNKDDFSTEMLEWRLGTADAINYSGDLLHPPLDDEAAASRNKSVLGYGRPIQKKTIRDDGNSSSDDDY